MMMIVGTPPPRAGAYRGFVALRPVPRPGICLGQLYRPDDDPDDGIQIPLADVQPGEDAQYIAAVHIIDRAADRGSVALDLYVESGALADQVRESDSATRVDLVVRLIKTVSNPARRPNLASAPVLRWG